VRGWDWDRVPAASASGFGSGGRDRLFAAVNSEMVSGCLVGRESLLGLRTCTCGDGKVYEWAKIRLPAASLDSDWK
jgi:hypothetical protein